MTKKQSAGILMYRFRDGEPEVFLVHPGGPFWAKKDEGAWSIPKGEFEKNDDPLQAAKRELAEETRLNAEGVFRALTPLKQRSGKMVYAWIVSGTCDPEAIKSNTFSMEWPPKSGNQAEFPEIDRAGWFTIQEAAKKLLPSQLPLLEEMLEILSGSLTEGRLR
jgi:predicted NUDIX family NTP pyrophosphohydrolase